MFRTIINKTPLSTDTANNFFQNIYGDSFHNDVSFISTLRALVAPRMEKDDILSLRFVRVFYTAEKISETPDKRMVKEICEYFDHTQRGGVCVYSFNSSAQEDNYAALELLKSTFCKTYKGWHRLEKITDFYRKQFYVLCFINPELKSVVLFTDNMDIRRMHYLQCSIFAFMPWYFNPETGVTELEMELINSLRERTSEKYEAVITEIAKQYDFRATRIKRMLSGFETKFEVRECEAVKRRINDTVAQIKDLNTRIGSYLNNKNNLEIKLLGLEKRIAEGSEESEIMEYFLCNKQLSLFTVTDTRMVFGVSSYITYFDEDMASSVIGNRSSYLYRPGGNTYENRISPSSIEKLMKAIFIDQTLKIKVCAAYEFDLNGNVIAKEGFNFDNHYEFNDCMPNPHINSYGCMGNYERTINELLLDRNYIGAIEQCVASSKSLNFGDTTVMNTFALTIYGERRYNNKCIELPDGKVVDPINAIKWLEEQERV